MIPRLPRRTLLILVLLTALSTGGYLAASQLSSGWGYPLDDAWIHQTYARNLALRGEWAFIPGVPSAGSTAPLWSLLLSIGPLLRLGPFAWTFLLGWGLLFGLAVLCEGAFRAALGRSDAGYPWAGALIALEWHLAWASASGMETLLQAGIIALVLFALCAPQPGWLRLGLLTGASAWVRPDGITLLGPLLLVALAVGSGWRERARRAAVALLGFAILFLPYLGFNWALSGSIWPNTFYAKQAEYAIYQQLPIWMRLAGEFKLALIGAGVLLLPGFLSYGWGAVYRQDWPRIAGLLWWLGYIGIYAWRLPVEYQHGRYIIPAMPVYFLWGAVGMAAILRSIWGASGVRRVISRAWLASTALVLAAFWGWGGVSYATDVAIINTEMVRTSQWVAANTPQDALVAAHDIGALGYFGGRRILDLAGLISPDVIPFIRNESRLAEYLDRQGADYLVTFPSWYPLLTQGRDPLFTSGGTYAPKAGNDNMAVFRWTHRE